MKVWGAMVLLTLTRNEVKKMVQQKRKIGVEQDYPGAYAWPVFEVLCPECGQWSREYGDVDQQQDDGEWHQLCAPCGAKAFPEEYGK